MASCSVQVMQFQIFLVGDVFRKLPFVFCLINFCYQPLVCRGCLDEVVKTRSKGHGGGVRAGYLIRGHVESAYMLYACMLFQNVVGKSTHNVAGQMVHRVPVGNLTVFGFFLPNLGEEICASCFLALLAVIPCDFVFSDLKSSVTQRPFRVPIDQDRGQTFKNRCRGSGNCGKSHSNVRTNFSFPSKYGCRSGYWPIIFTYCNPPSKSPIILSISRRCSRKPKRR